MRYVWVIFVTLTVFGDVTQKDWDVKADLQKGIEHAVVLYEKGVIDETFTYQLSKRTHEIKIKFLSKKGIEDYGTKILSFRPPGENISSIKGTVYLPDGKTIKLSKDDIHKKKTSREYGVKRTELSIVFPGLVEGAIVEFKYQRTFNWLQSIYHWSFQSDLYCMKSEIRYIPWPTIPWGVCFPNSLAEPVTDKRKFMLKPSFLATRTEIPPLKEEAYSLSNKTLREAVYFYHKEDIRSKNDFWKEVGKHYYNLTLKKMFKPLKKLKNDISVEPDDPDAINKIFSYVVSHYVSFASMSKEDESKIDLPYLRKLFQATRISELTKMPYLYKDQINYVLGAYLATFLPDAQIEYVLYLPWNEGLFNPNIKTLSQFTGSMLKVTHKGKIYWLSPVWRFLPINQMPYGAYGNQLLIIGKGKVYFDQLPVPSYRGNITQIELDFVLSEDADQATITRKRTLNPFSSYNKRSQYFYYGEMELEDRLLGDLKKEFGVDTSLEAFSAQNLKEIEKPLTIVEEFTIPVDIEEVGDYLLFKTVGLLDIKHNPFNKKDRKQNIIFPYPYQTKTLAFYHLGESYVVHDVPKGVRINDAVYTFRMKYKKSDDHNFSVASVLTLDRNYFKNEAAEFFRNSIGPMMKSTSQPVLIEEAE